MQPLFHGGYIIRQKPSTLDTDRIAKRQAQFLPVANCCSLCAELPSLMIIPIQSWNSQHESFEKVNEHHLLASLLKFKHLTVLDGA